MVEKITRKGKSFYTCTNYPKCKLVLWEEPVKEDCPECGSSYLLKQTNGSLKCPSCGRSIKKTIVEEYDLGGVKHRLIKLRRSFIVNN